MISVLALSGSLRQESKNTAFLQAAALVAPENVRVHLYPHLGDLPPFNPDLEDQVGPAVQTFRQALAEADALLICCPEYAHGVPGAFKNALDWVVSSGELVGKPVGLLNASAQGEFAQASLEGTLHVMSARLVPAACLRIAVAGPPQGAGVLAALPEVAQPLIRVLTALREACGSVPGPASPLRLS
jgi:chromate reductase, NAD(P)H dehydrogenase (quinone)